MSVLDCLLKDIKTEGIYNRHYKVVVIERFINKLPFLTDRMADAEETKRVILGQIGEQALNALRESGIDVDSAITKILEERAKQQKGLEAQAESGDINNMMTSELAYKSSSPEDAYGLEFARRLRGIGLTDAQVSSSYHIEQLILSVDGQLSEDRKQPWARRYFLMHDSSPEKLPKKEFLTLSELILITDDANSAFVRDHEVLPEDAWVAVCIAACCAEYTEARYAYEFEGRAEKLGWSKSQRGAYTRNECLLTDRLKWGNGDRPAWTPETCDLGLYQK